MPCPLGSKLQNEVAVSMMEAEYIALSTAMQDLIPLQTLVSEVHGIIGWLALLLNLFQSVQRQQGDTHLSNHSLHDPMFQTYCCQVSFFQGTCALGSYSYSQGL